MAKAAEESKPEDALRRFDRLLRLRQERARRFGAEDHELLAAWEAVMAAVGERKSQGPSDPIRDALSGRLQKRLLRYEAASAIRVRVSRIVEAALTSYLGRGEENLARAMLAQLSGEAISDVRASTRDSGGTHPCSGGGEHREGEGGTA